MTDEILVHISTSATLQNDDLYRSVAEAYKEFESYRRHGDDVDLVEACQASGDQVPHNISVLSVANATPAKRDLNSNHSDGYQSSMFTTSKDSYGSFPSYVSSEGQQRSNSQLYYDDGSPSTSSRLAKLNRIHVNWRHQTTPKTSGAGRQRQTPLVEEEEEEENEEADTAFIEDSQLAAQILQSQLQDDYSTTDEDTGEDERSEVEDDEESDQDNLQTVGLESRWEGPSSSAAEVPSSTYSPEMSSFSANHQESRLLDTTLDFSLFVTQDADETQLSLDTSIVALNASDFTKIPVNVFPPAPEVSVAETGTLPSQITKHLAGVKVQNPTRFKPSKKVRALQSDERGHWCVDCSSWPQALQHEFWGSLYEHVQSGRLGWATTLHRDSKYPEKIGIVKVYCWGEVVEHMWLLMWLCSKGRVSGSESKWLDADGIAVIEIL